MPGKHNHYRDKSFERGYMSTGDAGKGTVKALQELGDNVLAAAVKALSAGADVIVEDAKTRCPVYKGTKRKNGTTYMDKRAKPGALRDSIRVKKMSNGTAFKIVADAADLDGFFYGQIVEFGPDGRPFLYPAYDAHKSEIRDSIIEAIKGECRKVGR